MLADGSNSVFDIYEVTITWHGRPRRIAVDAAECAPLLGMSLLYGCELIVQVTEGRRVAVSPLP